MGIQKHAKTIDDHEVIVVSFSARRALTYKFRLIKMLGGSLGTIIDGVMEVMRQNGNVSREMAISNVADACERLSVKLSPQETLDFIIELLQTSHIDGKEVNSTSFDELFTENLAFMYKVLWYVLEVNYGDFLSKGGIGNPLNKDVSSTNQG